MAECEAMSSDPRVNLERERVRDLLRYYNPSSKRLRSANDKPNSLHELPDDLPNPASSTGCAGEVEDDAPDESRLLAHDPTLTAFAQLGAFRLNCQRAFISLMDHENQYILAEATRTVSLDTRNQTDNGDEIYLGPRELDMVWGVCPNTIQVFTASDDSKNVSTANVVANQKCYVMNDLSAIEAFKNRPYVAGWPHMRFYAEVPIHSPTGHVIGTYCVVDDKSREGLDKKGLQALNEISSAIMKHLELVQMQHGLQRAGEMVKGLGLFVDGKSSVQESWNADLDSSGCNPNSLESGRAGLRSGTVRTLSASTLAPEGDLRSIKSQPVTPPSSKGSEKSLSVYKHAMNKASSPALEQPSLASPSRDRQFSSHDVARHESIASRGIKKLFLRASTLIREALDLDGILFVDACLRDIAVTPDQAVQRTQALRFPALVETPFAEGADFMSGPGNPDNNSGYPSPPLEETLQGQVEEENNRPTLAQSDLLGSSVVGEKESYAYKVPLSQSTLRGLLRKYRHGHVFVFDEDGSIIQEKEVNRQNTTDVADRIKTQPPNSERSREELWTRQLLSICPGARALIFFPLWDPQRDQWFAGSLAWTTDPARILGAEDLTYLAAFGSCIMSEKSRLDALSADRAKADFISSVSHELRSPLHGILASAEALQTTSTGFEQDDMIRTIAICGQVLLETVDQILDYSKVSNSREKMASKAGQNPTKEMAPNLNKIECIDLSAVVENVVEGIFTAYQYRESVLGSRQDDPQSSNQESGSTVFKIDSIMIILSVDWLASSIFKSKISPWKRILTNIFGNALKYTTSGFIHVSLKTKAGLNPTQTIVELQVEDSGKGISKDYLKYELYTPFAQEDPLSAGTGLGLSIVHQLATDLGGTVSIQSEIGFGTTVTVSVSLESTQRLHEPQNVSTIGELRERSKVFTLCLVSLHALPDILDAPSGILTPPQRRMLALKSSITTFAVDWFGMEITTASSLSEANGDVVIALQSQIQPSETLSAERPLILFEDGDNNLLPERSVGVFLLSQPIGPRKLAKVLAQCLDYISNVIIQPSPEGLTQITEVEVEMPSIVFKNRPNPLHYGSLERLRASITTPVKTPLLTPTLATFSPEQLYRRAQSSRALRMIQKLQITQAAEKVPQTKTKTVVFLVEDNIINLKILVNYMRRAKVDCMTAENGLEALQKYQESHSTIKLIFMDISMPIMDGLTSTRQIRLFERENSLPRTRIAAITCFSTDEYQRNAIVSGADMFLVKPVAMKSLQPILDMDPLAIIADDEVEGVGDRKEKT